MVRQLIDFKQDIQPLFNEVIKYSQNWCDENINSDQVFDLWIQNKEKFFKAFDNRLIVEGPDVCMNFTKEEKNKKLQDFIHTFTRSVYNDTTFGIHFVTFLKQLEGEDFFNNSLPNSYTITYEDGSSKVIPAGSKIVKAFKYFIKEPVILRNWQDKASMIIQENEIRGKLCLSIHPLDYLSISENASNWRSCHALDGEHKAGNLSYMGDASTIIAYIKSDKGDCQITRFPSSIPWNNKKWRCLLFFSSTGDMIFAGRPYPFACQGALKQIKDFIFTETELTGSREYRGSWTGAERWITGQIKEVVIDEESQSYFDYYNRNIQDRIKFGVDRCFVAQDGSIATMNELMSEEVVAGHHYNDLLWSSVYFPYHLLAQYSNVSGQKFPIGSVCNCLRCGKKPIYDSGVLTCYPCTDEGRSYAAFCSCCDLGVLDADELYYVDGEEEYVCQECWEEFTNQCACCGHRFYTRSLKYNEVHKEIYCENCEENLDKTDES